MQSHLTIMLIMANTRPLCVMCHVQVYFYTSVHSYNFKAEGDFWNWSEMSAFTGQITNQPNKTKQRNNKSANTICVYSVNLYFLTILRRRRLQLLFCDLAHAISEHSSLEIYDKDSV